MFDANQSAVEFRPSLAHRIGALAVAIVCLAAAAALVWVDRCVFRIGPQADVCAVIFCLIALWGVSACRRKLRVDKQGIWQGRFLRSCDLWSWDEFAGGQIRFEGTMCAFVGKRTPVRSSRILRLGLLAEADQKQILDWIELVWQQPQISLPTELAIELCGESIRIDPAGINITSRSRAHSCHWTDVEQLEIIRQHHNRDDFRRLVLKLPEWEMVLDCQRGRRNWNGPDDEVVARFLTVHVPQEKQFIRATLDPPRTMREAAVRSDESLKELRSTEKVRTITWFGVVGIVECASILREPRVLFALVYVVPFAIAVFAGQRRAKQEYEKLLQWQQDLEAQQQGRRTEGEGAVDAKSVPSSAASAYSAVNLNHDATC
ncbi:MAG: hypothetical protein WD845_04085 [Pirellulales bacterium]